ncbi:unnamed protein product [Darwinula stevensoni]|uniref:SANT domain-containing protein n=1 Tax=Darwinula stevensoni TaxID=69355 RepID=A0A7R8X5Q6_9CRUS|nr:unnamed protein product [Darwinula stevensoni]CAG0878847.1 unnamed protein product [Darwinula stevensoni]
MRTDTGLHVRDHDGGGGCSAGLRPNLDCLGHESLGFGLKLLNPMHFVTYTPAFLGCRILRWSYAGYKTGSAIVSVPGSSAFNPICVVWNEVGGDRSGVRSKYLGSMARGSSLLHPLDYVDHPRGPGPGFPPVSPYRAYHDVLPHHRSYLEREGGLATSCTGTGTSGTGNESTLGGGGPAPKKIRLGMGVGALGLGLGLGVLDAKPELRQPLRVDVDSPQASSASAAGTLSQGLDRKELQYQPQVEAISPTLPGESMLDESLRSTKEDLLQRINKVDRDIAVVESQIAKTTKKQQELEEAAKRGDKDHEEETPKESKHQSIAQVIYAENRRRAQQSYEKLTKLGPSLDLPLYMQPSDVPVYQENKRTHAAFKPRLMKFLAREQEEKRERDQYLVDTYSHLMKIWLKKTEKIENSLKRKTRDAKFREHFEKVFPELKKQREDKERFSRMGARVKSDADMEEIKDFLQEKEMEERKMRQLAVIPPAVVTLKERRRHINNQNGFTEDPLAIYKERQWISVWSDAEKELFKERYLQHQKQFGIVASYLERKTVNDCVQYYYLSKKKETYKQLLRKSRARNRARAVGKPGTATGHPAQTVLDTVGGVTTRGSMQREQMAIATSSSHAQAHASAMSEVQVPRTESMAVSVSDEVHDSSRVEEKVKAEPSATQYEQISNESTSLEGEIMGKNQKARTKGHIDTDSSDDDLDYDRCPTVFYSRSKLFQNLI